MKGGESTGKLSKEFKDTRMCNVTLWLRRRRSIAYVLFKVQNFKGRRTARSGNYKPSARY